MSELNQSSAIDQIKNKIYEEMGGPDPFNTRIITDLCDLRTREEFQSLSDVDFYDIVGKTFSLNPEYFMKSIYGDSRLYQHVDKKEMAKHIVEKYCLYDGEEILYECNGNIVQKNVWKDNVKALVKNAIIFVTNNRIIAQGKLDAKGGADTWLPIFLWGFSGSHRRTKSKKGISESSSLQELPCYGYQFKTKNHQGLKKKTDGIKYSMNIEDDISKVSGTQQVKGMREVRITLPNPNKEQITNLFEVLCKDANQIMNSIRELFYMELDQKRKQLEFLRILHPSIYFPSKGKILSKLQSDEVHQFSDSDYLEIVKETYKLDPEYFMTSIYPKMMSWKYSKFISVIDVKEEIKALLDKLSKESGV